MKTEQSVSLDIFLTSISLGVIFTTQEGIITKTNPYLRHQFGYEEELIGESVSKLIPALFHNSDPLSKNGDFKKLRKQKSKINFEISAIKKNGHLFLAEVTLDDYKTPQNNDIIILIKEIGEQKERKPLNTGLGEEINEPSIAIARNEKTLHKLISVTKEKDIKLKKVNNFLKSIWNYVDAIIFVTDCDGVIKMFNPKAEEKLGYNANELIDNESLLLFFNREELIERGRKLAVELNKNITKDFSILTLPADLGLPNEFETTFVRKDNTSFPVSITINKMGNLNKHTPVEGYIGIARDISEKKKVEIELINNLEKEKELSDLRFRLLSLASHELKTPLNVILFSTSIISKYNKTKDQPKREKQLQRIANCVNNLNDLLKDLLLISNLEKGMFPIKNAHFTPKEHIKEIIEEISVLLKKGQVINYKHIGKNLVYLDPDLLKLILVNLLSNAIKYSPESSRIFINSKITDNEFLLSIKDNGCGISEEDRPHLFNRFYRGSNVSDIEGSGLGLYIISNYLESMKGKLDFNSKLNVGTKVKLIFKLDEVSETESQSPVLIDQVF